MEHEETAEGTEHEGERLEEQSERVDEHIREARDDWERKERDPAVPGAQPKESDQLPEEGPAEQVPDDTDGRARDKARESPRTPDEEGTATGNPHAAGSDE
jgi:hypothetical protein